MSGSTWKTGAPMTRSKPIARPTGAQLIRQLLTLGFISVGWVIVLVVALSVAGTGAENITVNREDDTAVASQPTAVPPTAAPTTSAPTVAAPTTSTPTIASSLTSASTTLAPTQPPTGTATPEATATRSATPASTPTTAPTAVASPAPTVAATAASSGGGGAVTFSRDVKPILDRVCVKCHGGEETKEGLVLKSYAELMAGSFNGLVVAPGDTANSLLIELITNGKMPKKGPKLLPAEIRAFTNWVAAGAKNN